MTAFHRCVTGAAESEDRARRGSSRSDWSPACVQNDQQPPPPSPELNVRQMRRLIRQLRCFSGLVPLSFIYGEQAAHLHLLSEHRKPKVVLMSSVLDKLIRLCGSMLRPPRLPTDRSALHVTVTEQLNQPGPAAALMVPEPFDWLIVWTSHGGGLKKRMCLMSCSAGKPGPHSGSGPPGPPGPPQSRGSVSVHLELLHNQP